MNENELISFRQNLNNYKTLEDLLEKVLQNIDDLVILDETLPLMFKLNFELPRHFAKNRQVYFKFCYKVFDHFPSLIQIIRNHVTHNISYPKNKLRIEQHLAKLANDQSTIRKKVIDKEINWVKIILDFSEQKFINNSTFHDKYNCQFENEGQKDESLIYPSDSYHSYIEYRLIEEPKFQLEVINNYIGFSLAKYELFLKELDVESTVQILDKEEDNSSMRHLSKKEQALVLFALLKNANFDFDDNSGEKFKLIATISGQNPLSLAKLFPQFNDYYKHRGHEKEIAKCIEKIKIFLMPFKNHTLMKSLKPKPLPKKAE